MPLLEKVVDSHIECSHVLECLGTKKTSIIALLPYNNYLKVSKYYRCIRILEPVYVRLYTHTGYHAAVI